MTRDSAVGGAGPSLQRLADGLPAGLKKGTDPENGLASVEALFLAYQMLGRPTEGLLDHYRWAEEFLRLNAALGPESATD